MKKQKVMFNKISETAVNKKSNYQAVPTVLGYSHINNLTGGIK